MLKSTRNIAIYTLFLCIATTAVFSQPPHAKERIDNVKKVKLLDALDLDEQQSEKFLTKYSSWEKKIQEKKEVMETTTDEIELLIKKKAGNDEITKKTKEFLTLQSQFSQLITDKFKEFEAMLNPVNFAKFVMFEERFTKELQRMLMKRFDREEKREFRKGKKGDLREEPRDEFKDAPKD
ncbi:MAG TPA: hypothetical protein PKY56_14200 [Candidatus Kapabacteria bacterium]|nr:hypothetical protein [Candidatus Kapabacteria bacterium]HPO64311.1 hypothetical protein [Candidatus Kapabacteria bacterium]